MTRPSRTTITRPDGWRACSLSARCPPTITPRNPASAAGAAAALGTAVSAISAEGLAAELRDAGLDACRTAEFDGPESLAVWGVDAVTVGLDREADWHDLAVATDAVRAGAPLIVPNRDANYPDPGRLVPGTGAAVAALEAATGVRAMAIGKPAPDLLLRQPLMGAIFATQS